VKLDSLINLTNKNHPPIVINNIEDVELYINILPLQQPRLVPVGTKNKVILFSLAIILCISIFYIQHWKDETMGRVMYYIDVDDYDEIDYGNDVSDDIEDHEDSEKYPLKKSKIDIEEDETLLFSNLNNFKLAVNQQLHVEEISSDKFKANFFSPEVLLITTYDTTFNNALELLHGTVYEYEKVYYGKIGIHNLTAITHWTLNNNNRYPYYNIKYLISKLKSKLQLIVHVGITEYKKNFNLGDIVISITGSEVNTLSMFLLIVNIFRLYQGY